MNIFLINFIVYLLLWIFFYKRIKRFNFFMVAWSCYTISALMSYIALKGDFYYYPEAMVLKTVSWVPLLFVLIFYLIVSIPFLKVDERKIRLLDIDVEYSNYRTFVLLNLVFFIVVSIMKLYETVTINTLYSYGELYAHYHDDSIADRNVVVNLYDNRLLQMISGVGGNYCPTMSPLIALYYLSKIAHAHRITASYIFGLIIAIFPVFIQSVIGVSRGGLFFSMFLLLFYYLIIRHYINRVEKKQIFVSIAVTVVLFFSVSYSITESRVEERNSNYDAFTDIMIYFGQPMINAAFYHDKIHYHPNGERMLDRLYGIKTGEVGKSYQDYWNNKTGAEVQLFKTLFGDMYLEFGLIMSIIIIVVTTFLWNSLVLKNYRDPIYIPFLWFYFNILIFGVFNYKIDTFKGVWFPAFVVFCIMISAQMSKRKNKKLIVNNTI